MHAKHYEGLHHDRYCGDHDKHGNPSHVGVHIRRPSGYAFAPPRYASLPASTASVTVSRWRSMISLLRSSKSSARSRSSRALRCAYSLPSSALPARYSRVSSPDFGAKRIPKRVPTPSPTRKKLTLDPTLSLIEITSLI